MVPANLDHLLADAGYKLVFPEDLRITDGRRNRGPLHSYLHADKNVISPRSLPFTIDTRHLSPRMYLNALSWDGKAWAGEGGNIYSPSENVRSWWGADWYNDPLNAGYPVAD